MKYSLLPALFLIIVAVISPLNQASAQPSHSYIQLAQSSQSLDKAVQSVKQKTGGRILSTKTVTKNGKRVHKIKVLLPSGKVQVFRVNAN